MKITEIRTQLYEYELTRPLGDANSPHGRHRACDLAVMVDTDAGLTGVSIGNPGAQSLVLSLGQLLVGNDPRGVRGLWKRMVDKVFKGGNEGTANDAIGCLDVALWDIKAKANDEPLWKTLGATTRYVDIYASGIDSPLTDDALRTFYEGMAARGVSAGKLKVGLDRDADTRRIGIMKDALTKSGKTPSLMIDSNEYWSPKQAIRHIRYFEEQFDLTWVEEPARRWDYRGLRQVSQAVRAAVATGENLDDLSNYMPLVANEAVDVVQIGIGTSGITGAMQVADLAYAFELPVALMSCPGHFMGHLAACLPNHWMMEVVDAGQDKALKRDNAIESGQLVLGDSPGIGIEFDKEILAQHAVVQPSPGAGASPWGRRRGAGLCEIGPDEPDVLPSE
jgi:L-alanine-DL-glutamate epimerase-like enolase superfamily enzyme